MRDLSLHLMDIIQNSIKAQASMISTRIIADKKKDQLMIEIIDNGVGMDQALLNQIRDPFVTTRTTRKVGLGIPLLEASAKRAEGEFMIESQKYKGTSIKAKFKISHIDRLPLGNVAETFMSLVSANKDINFSLELSNMQEIFKFSVFDVKNRLNGISIDNIDVLIWIRDYINEGVNNIFGGVLNEILS